ncbi:efflux MFS transporter permease [Frigidibacter oleivorans]|uniref:MFS transporter n=1 Tax=Frigidibacter oleivorans TaxID=2487129 RepID=UPI000F8CB0BB|nr:MFS transporter [Frigidibacter oleivorans]
MTAAPDVPTPAAPSPEAGFPLHRALPYFVASALLALSQGLGQGFVTANVAQYAGDLGITTTEASWLLAAYLVPRASITLILIKIRTQYGLRRFAEIGTALYLAVAFASVWINDLRSAVVLQFLAGIASAPLSTLGFLYMLEPLPQQWKMRLGLPMVLVLLMSAPTLARVISPALVGDGGLEGIHLTTLALAMLSLVAVRLLPLRPVPHMKVIQPLDLLSFALIAFAFGGIATGFVMGPIHWWGDTAWIGWLLAGSVAALALTVVIELHRPEPLLDIRWLVSPAMLHLTATLFLFRLLLSEQSTGAPRMFQALGLAPSQMTGLFAVICLASLIGGLACVAWMKPGREPQFHLVALLLIAIGAFMDSHATVDTRPAQMIVSQSLIGFAGMLFMPPAMLKGLMAALARGPNYLLSFVVVFLSSQSLGGVIGSGLFTTIINRRQAFHYQGLAEQLQATDPGTMRSIAGGMAALAGQMPDAAARRLQAVSALAQDAAAQAYVMAYNDAYFLTFLCAAGAAGLLLLHLLRDRLAARLTPPSPSDIQTAS